MGSLGRGEGGGAPNLHVDLKKWPCPLSPFLQFLVDFKMVPCHMSTLRNTPFYVVYLFPCVGRLHVACRF